MGDDIVKFSTEKETLKNQIGSHDEKGLEVSNVKLLKQFDDEKRATLIMSRMEKQVKEQYQMAYLSYEKLWVSEFDNIVS